MITLYHNDMSSCSQKVRFVLEEKNIEWSSVEVDLKQGEQFRKEYTSLNSKAVVPTLIHNGSVITESAVICQYLDEAFQGTDLTPIDALNKAKMRIWLQQVDEHLHADISIIGTVLAFSDDINKKHDTPEKLDRFLAKIPDPSKRKLRKELIEEGVDSAAFAHAIRHYRAFFFKLDDTLKQSKYIVGQHMSIADIVCLPYLLRFLHLDQKSLFSGFRNILRWYERMCDTVGYRRGIEAWFKQESIEKMQNAGELKRASIDKIWQGE